MDEQRQEMVEKDHNEAVKQYSNSVADQATRKAYEARSECNGRYSISSTKLS
jgi:hypothetical protein